MKRLGKSLTRRVLSAFKAARLMRLAEWMDVSVSDPNLVQYITDAMASGGDIQIDYEGSGWRTILPYGWNTSKEGNILLMCYKDTGEIRSYRLDRVLEVRVDSNSAAGQDMASEDQGGGDMPNFDLPGISPSPEQTPEQSPFEQQMQTLEDDDVQETQQDNGQSNEDNDQETQDEQPEEMAG